MTTRRLVYRKPGGAELVIASGGKLTVQSGGAIVGPNPTGETDYYVDSSVSASGAGTSWPTAFKTIAEAVAVPVVAGDRVFIKGSFNEAVTLAVAGVALIGVGTTSAQCLWTAPDTAAPCLTVSAAADVVVDNIRFRPPVANAAIALTGACHQFRLQDCRIQGKAGSWYGISSNGLSANARITGCEFYYINTASYGIAIYGHTYATGEHSGWVIEDCLFHSNLKHISCRLRQGIIQRCVFAGKGLIANGTMDVITTGIDISGAIGGCNIVYGCMLGGDYSNPTYVAGTDDCWIGNIAEDIAEAEVEADGHTNAVPAA